MPKSSSPRLPPKYRWRPSNRTHRTLAMLATPGSSYPSSPIDSPISDNTSFTSAGSYYVPPSPISSDTLSVPTISRPIPRPIPRSNPPSSPSPIPRSIPPTQTTSRTYGRNNDISYAPPEPSSVPHPLTSSTSITSPSLSSPSSLTCTSHLFRMLNLESTTTQKSVPGPDFHVPPLYLPPQGWTASSQIERRFGLSAYLRRAKRLADEFLKITGARLAVELIILSNPPPPPDYLRAINERHVEAEHALNLAHDHLFRSMHTFPYVFFSQNANTTFTNDEVENVDNVIRRALRVQNRCMVDIREFIKGKARRRTREEVWGAGLECGGAWELVGMCVKAEEKCQVIVEELGPSTFDVDHRLYCGMGGMHIKVESNLDYYAEPGMVGYNTTFAAGNVSGQIPFDPNLDVKGSNIVKIEDAEKSIFELDMSAAEREEFDVMLKDIEHGGNQELNSLLKNGWDFDDVMNFSMNLNEDDNSTNLEVVKNPSEKRRRRNTWT